MFELVLIYSFMASACSNPTAPISSTIPVYAWNPPTRNHSSADYRGDRMNGDWIVVVSCTPYQKKTYLTVDRYPTLAQCMKRVARVGNQDNLQAICRRK